ncbi:helix-turn-helix domain-containing protein [Staphylococcus massiliensis]|uniref:Helicase Helix-turn-helix domain-containing protein n=1 Tax=Staphylococcus massiliensis S46 TaxID=1229783 RepID=K9ARA0_9STAP|nr:helix-turn-helix domain-containing protein [Staphylococcus massiliensis]EKU49809.1 hypothetical protein C273_02895 [Staphylococcus massiliensis S46]MCG3398914.1 helix-turn-helix domain-containing protein [Staphylococcus massiliensis]MCG3401083.1 helix-turn-helix domain-containing protein [Staphylococcus massiliensis]POA01141.1 hypothetical protein CD133_02690 [Staphylococcus massiliensis CCUG 55927]
MERAVQILKQRTFNYKTEKSIFNIITGKKSHQTFFDACIQDTLPLYQSMPNLNSQTFLQLLQSSDNTSDSLPKLFGHTYMSMRDTFTTIQLLVQVVSQYISDNAKYLPITSNLNIQQKVKGLFKEMKEEETISQLEDELMTLFEVLESELEVPLLHYYLDGYDEHAYTRQQVSLITSLSLKEVWFHELIALHHLVKAISNQDTYPLLSRCVEKPTLLHQTFTTYQQLLKEPDVKIEDMAARKNVKPNTIEDHILELFIKGYLHDFRPYVPSEGYADLKAAFLKAPNQRLKYFKEAFPDWSYFQIKMAFVKVRKEVYDASRK